MGYTNAINCFIAAVENNALKELEHFVLPLRYLAARDVTLICFYMHSSYSGTVHVLDGVALCEIDVVVALSLRVSQTQPWPLCILLHA